MKPLTFKLRTMMWVVCALSCLMAFIAFRIESQKRQIAAREHFEAAGAQVGYENHPDLQHLCSIPPNWGWRYVEEYVGVTTICGDDFTFRVVAVRFFEAPTADVDWGRLREFPQLRYLICPRTVSFGDGELAQVAMCPTLEILMLSNTAVSDEGIALLDKLPALTFVNLENTRVTDEGRAAFLRSHPNCEIVY